MNAGTGECELPTSRGGGAGGAGGSSGLILVKTENLDKSLVATFGEEIDEKRVEELGFKVYSR